jgi:hypothetical protein
MNASVPKHGAQVLAAILALGALGAAHQTDAAPPTVAISLAWKGDPPTAVALGGVYPPAPLKLNSDKTAFEIQFAPPAADTYLSSLSLDAAYDGDVTLSLPIRVWPKLAGLVTTVYQIKYTACSPADLKAAESPSGTIPGALKSFFTARALYVLQGDDRCSLNNRKRAARAWFDRAYELTKLANYFDLSPEAAAAYSNYDPAYVKTYQDQAKGKAIRLISEQRLNAFHAGRYEEALGLNASLLNAITSDPSVRDVSHRLQGVTEDQLNADNDKFAGRAAKAGVAVTATTSTLELAPKAALATAAAPSR